MATASDNFNRANGEIGANWTEDAGDIDIVSNKADSQAGAWNRARYTATPMDSADHYVQADIGIHGPFDHGGVTARQASSTHTCYVGTYLNEDTGTGYTLRRMLGGNAVALDEAASGNGTKTFKLIVDGASQVLEVDTVEVCSDTDSAIAAGAYCGIQAFDENGLWDDWSAADLAAAGLSIPVAMHHYTKNIASGR